MTVRQGRDPDEERPAWVQPLMQWSTIENVRARLKGPAGHVPSEIGGIVLSNVGRQLLACWLEARGSRAMPGPDDVSPRALVELMPYIRYLSWEDDNRLVFRIYGSALAEATGLDITGYDLFGLGHDEVETDRARLRKLHEQPCGIVMIRDVFDSGGNSHPCEFMTLPVAPGADGKKRIIGTIVPAERIEVWDTDVAFVRTFTLRRAAYFDTGSGVPDPASGLEV